MAEKDMTVYIGYDHTLLERTWLENDMTKKDMITEYMTKQWTYLQRT